MKTRRSSLPAPDAVAPEGKLRVSSKGVAKQKTRKQRNTVVVVQPAVVIKGRRQGSGTSRRGGSRQRTGPTGAAAAAAAPPALPLPAAPAAAQQQPGAKRRSSVRRASAAAAAAHKAEPGDATISDLSAEALQEVFQNLALHQSWCREVLPLVCKRFRDVLAQPSPMWEALQINFLDKGMLLGGEGQEEEDAGDAAEAGRRRRLLHSAVERWLRPRAAGVKGLLLMFSSLDPTHSFPSNGRGLRRVLTMLPGLRELRISSCSDIFHGRSFAELEGLQQLRVLAVTCNTAQLSSADLAPLERLKQLQSLTIHCSRQHEDAAEPCLQSFPDSLLKLRGLQELALCSTGVHQLPAGLATRLKSLTALDVSGCPIVTLPSNFWRCAELRHLRLNGTNAMVMLPQFWTPLMALPKLEALELRDTKARSLPNSLTGLLQLTSLDLSENIFEHFQPLECLGCLQQMPKLQRLLLQRCQMSTVPATVCSLSTLTHLDISSNYLVDLPEELGLMSGLRELAASGNTFPRIPEALMRLPALELADLSFNIYMEAAASMDAWATEGYPRIRRIDARKMLGAWKQSSIKWLEKLNAALAAQGRPARVVVWE